MAHGEILSKIACNPARRFHAQYTFRSHLIHAASSPEPMRFPQYRRASSLGVLEGWL
ncbi:hypothetical protein BDQ94DRAFT_140893 [Aspergillus welwitschiae]|uniref:Uncharacterized protein n=1 Tax=Aspergillus welwitschiae TaxID=1341132 RepID=A0A3F3Q6J8_9EURO|nr:hypothetical protein BDQ94DRAFT_140893 [Aspergillus welwitschiae]RDH34791.1 hypothetical protein BDQ94DRAFT_140893 [Aspergillus welwitschiae]